MVLDVLGLMLMKRCLSKKIQRRESGKIPQAKFFPGSLFVFPFFDWIKILAMIFDAGERNGTWELQIIHNIPAHSVYRSDFKHFTEAS